MKIVLASNDDESIFVKQHTGEIGDRPVEIAPRTVESLLALNSKFLREISTFAHMKWLMNSIYLPPRKRPAQPLAKTSEAKAIAYTRTASMTALGRLPHCPFLADC
ncbi:MAG: hypothetical protein V5B30_07570 [Candidatus Accumulibacter delftensis]